MATVLDLGRKSMQNEYIVLQNRKLQWADLMAASSQKETTGHYDLSGTVCILDQCVL